jgi:hypothetical protein
MDDKQFLYDKYITDPSKQHVLDNDGAFITFYESYNTIVTLHQSNETEDNYVCVPIECLSKIVNDFKTNN